MLETFGLYNFENSVLGPTLKAGKNILNFTASSTGIDRDWTVVAGISNNYSPLTIKGGKNVIFGEGLGLHSDRIDDNGNESYSGINAYGINNVASNITIKGGHNKITGIAKAFSPNEVYSYGIRNYESNIFIKGGKNDLRITSEASSDYFGYTYGLSNFDSDIKIIGGINNIDISAKSSSSYYATVVARGFYNGSSDFDITGGKNNIRVVSESSSRGRAFASGFINVGGTIKIIGGKNKLTARAEAFSSGGDLVSATSIYNSGEIIFSKGRDYLTGEALVTGYDEDSSKSLVNTGLINMGGGKDILLSKYASRNNDSINPIDRPVTLEGNGTIIMGDGADLFVGFGKQFVYGGIDASTNDTCKDTLNLGVLNKADLTIGASDYSGLNVATFTYGLITMVTSGFEEFVFADQKVSYENLI